MIKLNKNLLYENGVLFHRNNRGPEGFDPAIYWIDNGEKGVFYIDRISNPKGVSEDDPYGKRYLVYNPYHINIEKARKYWSHNSKKLEDF